MRPKAQRIAIAEACEWENILGTKWMCPDYLKDLNAMHEAEKVLTSVQEVTWFGEMRRVLAISQTTLNAFKFCHTTAEQRAEAFLRTLGLWKE